MSDSDLQGQYAGFISRAVGLVVDLVVVYLTTITVAWFTSGALSLVGIDINNCPTMQFTGLFSLLREAACYVARWFLVGWAALVPIGYFLLFWTLGGQTIGDYMVGVKVIRTDGGDVGFIRALIRWIGFVLCILSLGIGFLWVVIDDRRQGWHDKLAHTCVVYAWQARLNETTMNKVRRWLHQRQMKRDAKKAS
ncbi:MAG: RDD family protein [Anaerolineae bacterium]